jgi:hypothetical protein
MPVTRLLSPSALLVVVTLGLSCADKDGEKAVEDTTPASAEQNPPASPDVQAAAGNPVTAPLSAEDIGRWKKGIAGELKLFTRPKQN